MIAIVSSTLEPLKKTNKEISFYSNSDRIEQTKFSIKRLYEVGFSRILLVDNSPLLDKEKLQAILADYPEIEIYHILQYQFENKGVNEILMLLYLTDHLPTNEAIFKLSARYYPTADFHKPDFADLAVKKYYHKGLNSVSTRGYWVKDAPTLKRFLTDCLYEHFIYSQRIVGWGSFLRVLLKKRDRNTPRFSITIEFAAEHILRKYDYTVTYLNTIGIEGLIAGVDKPELITE